MIVAEIVRNKDFVVFLHSVAPFVFVGEIKYYSLRTSWGSSCDDLFTVGDRAKALQVTRDYLTKYLQEDTYAEMIIQEASYYFDKVNQRIYIHIEHIYSPLTAMLDYGYSFGVSDQELVYIDDYIYLPLITGSPDLNRETDYLNSDQPTGSTGTLTLSNKEYTNAEGVREGRLDFLLNEQIYGNDVFVYLYLNSVLTPIASKYVEDVLYGEEEVEIDLQDRRFS
jgi:hypothetical protein